VEPLFYEFAPLSTKAPALIPAIQRVTHKAGQDIPPENMLWMKASTKTIATNAYVSGLALPSAWSFGTRRWRKETPDEILMDFGHELGHYVLKHILKGMIFMAAMLLGLLYLGYRSIGWLLAKRGGAWGIRGLDDWASLPALLLLLTIFGFCGRYSWKRFQPTSGESGGCVQPGDQSRNCC